MNRSEMRFYFLYDSLHYGLGYYSPFIDKKFMAADGLLVTNLRYKPSEPGNPRRKAIELRTGSAAVKSNPPSVIHTACMTHPGI